MSRSGNGRGKVPLDKYFIQSASDEEILGYMHDMSEELASMCEMRGYDDLKPVFLQARQSISRTIKRHGN
uniref:Uncharacterized protein n=1 Tax=Aquisalinus luteolus TaxID=1566827 RepID=A0A8J3A153_9PROT|nr:hypothetical protein GCM10011355_11260 [Aquisalinus luteolus]